MRLPFKKIYRIQCPALGTTAEHDLPVFIAEFDGAITSVKYIPRDNFTAVDTNTRRLAIINKGSNGNGTTVAADLTLNVAGGGLTDYVAKTVTLHATVANRAVVTGDCVSLFSDAVGTGFADPGGLLEVEVTRETDDN